MFSNSSIFTSISALSSATAALTVQENLRRDEDRGRGAGQPAKKSDDGMPRRTDGRRRMGLLDMALIAIVVALIVFDETRSKD